MDAHCEEAWVGLDSTPGDLPDSCVTSLTSLRLHSPCAWEGPLPPGGL